MIARREDLEPPIHPMGIVEFERFLRAAAGLDMTS